MRDAACRRIPADLSFHDTMPIVPETSLDPIRSRTASLGVGVAYAKRLFEVAERFGLPRAALLRRARIGPADWEATQTRLPLAALVALFESALALTGRRDLGLEFGRQVRPGTFDVLGYALMTCRNLGEAIALVPQIGR